MTPRYHSASPSLGDILKGRRQSSTQTRTGNPVRRNSYDPDDERCRRFPLPFHEEEQAAFLQAAERYNLEHKEEGRYVGPFRARGMDVLRWLLREMKATGGRCCPSHAQIAAALKIGLRSVRRIMKALFIAGFLEWMRRSVEDNSDQGGAVRRQTSNLYRLNLPADLAGLVSRLVARRTGRPAAQPRGVRLVGAAELSIRPKLWERSLGNEGRLTGALAALAGMVDRAS